MGRWQREGHRWWGRRVLKMSVLLHPFPMGRPSLWGPTRSMAWYCMPLELIVSRNWVQRETKPLFGSRREPEGKEASSPRFPVTHRYQHKCLSLTEGVFSFWPPKGGKARVKGGSGERKPSCTCWVGQEPATRLHGLPRRLFLVGQDLSGGGGGHSTAFCACCRHSLCELSVGVLHEHFPSLCRVICLPGPISAHILWNTPWKAIFLFWSRSKIIHMMKCRQDACGGGRGESSSSHFNGMKWLGTVSKIWQKWNFSPFQVKALATE